MDGVEWARSKWGRVAKLWFKLMEAVAMWTPNRLIADAEGILRHLQSRHVHLPPTSVIAYGAPVVETAPDIDLLEEWQLDSGNYFLVVCRLEPENSVKEILKGYLQSQSMKTLVVVGDIARRTEYIRELLLLKDDRVRFVGPVYDKRKLQALRYYAFAYFHGHTVGGTNPSLLEALGCGNLVIAHDNGFNREVALESATYFSHEHHVAERIQTMESFPPELLDRLKVMARNRVATEYTWEYIADAYYSTLIQQLSHPLWVKVQVAETKVIAKLIMR
jgi:glycosyltransferase involved in cell wall biosynthesis